MFYEFNKSRCLVLVVDIKKEWGKNMVFYLFFERSRGFDLVEKSEDFLSWKKNIRKDIYCVRKVYGLIYCLIDWFKVERFILFGWNRELWKNRLVFGKEMECLLNSIKSRRMNA